MPPPSPSPQESPAIRYHPTAPTPNPDPWWASLPGFDRSLRRLNEGQILDYDLQPRRADSPGRWLSPRYRASVGRRGDSTLLRNEEPLLFRLDRGHAPATTHRDWHILMPEVIWHDGSTVSVARFYTGSGISASMAPSGLLHDYLTRQWQKDRCMPVFSTASAPHESRRKPVSLRDLARIWGASLASLSPRPRYQIRLLTAALALVHPFHLRLTGSFRPPAN